MITPFMVLVLSKVEALDLAKRFTSPSWVAQAVFPSNHPGWDRCCKCGPYGSTRGSGLVMAMGGYLGKLQRRGLVDRWDRKTALTQRGQDVLDSYRNLLTGVQDGSGT